MDTMNGQADTDGRSWKMLRDVEDVSPEIEQAVAECVSAFEGPLSTEEFIDDLCRFYGGSGWSDDDWDLDSYDNPAARKIMRIARRVRREEEGS